MVLEEGEAGLISEIPHEVVLLAILELNLMMDSEISLNLGDLLEGESDRGVVVDFNAVELTGDVHVVIPVGLGSLNAVDVVQLLDHLAGVGDVEPSLEEGHFVLLRGVDHVGDSEVGDHSVSHGSELGDLPGNELLFTLFMDGEERDVGIGGSLIVASGHGVIEAGIVRT